MTKERVLTILKQTNDYLSGEEMSRRLSVSRAAVNGAVQALRKEGYSIASLTNKGYLLTDAPDVLRWGEIAPWLSEERAERLCVFETVESTNSWLKAQGQQGLPTGYVAVAEQQTGGRGRLGRSFASPKGKGVYLSILLRPDCAPQDAASLTAWTAVAAAEAIERVCGVRPGIKWINDLVLGTKKIAGILTEMSVEWESGNVQYVVVGIGVNANHALSDFPEEIQNIAGSLFTETGKIVDRGRLAAELILAFDRMMERWPAEKETVLREYRKACVTTGKEVKLIRGDLERQAFAKEIDDDFALVVELPDGKTETVFTGEASVRGLFGYV